MPGASGWGWVDAGLFSAQRVGLTLALVAAALIATPTALSPVSAPGMMTVNTIAAPTRGSPVVDATGVFAGCTTVTDQGVDETSRHGTIIFSGVKLVSCQWGTLLLAYTVDKKPPGTQGSWRVVGGSDTYARAHGGGQLTGNYTLCNPMGTAGCVLDSYIGLISPE